MYRNYLKAIIKEIIRKQLEKMLPLMTQVKAYKTFKNKLSKDNPGKKKFC